MDPTELCFSPDEKILYVVNAAACLTRKILAYDVAPDGAKLANKRSSWSTPAPGAPTGCAAISTAICWCSGGMGDHRTPTGVVVFTPDGLMIGRIALPERCAKPLLRRIEAQTDLFHGREPVDLPRSYVNTAEASAGRLSSLPSFQAIGRMPVSRNKRKKCHAY